MMDSKYILEVKDLLFWYSKSKPLLVDVNFRVKRGEIVGITGENGSGKTTLLKLIVGLLKPKKGEIIIRGRVGYSPQQLLLFENLTVLENFLIFGRGLNLGREEIEREALEIMRRLNFLEYKDVLVKNLSGGTAQKLNFGISLLGDPDLLVLDEPYQGMDYASFISFWDIQRELRDRGKAIIIVSHLIEDTSKLSRNLHLTDKRIIECIGTNCPICGG